ncbi:MAG TPA: malto-oligosyltrehalose trehalohydrolase, partial [Azospirillaceae bacterium]|nr:malto-oligosyltrehalose trehalohydrolase [Azospirillaceae bacterium]
TLHSWVESVAATARATLDRLDAALPTLPPVIAAEARTLQACEAALFAQIEEVAALTPNVQRQRLHGGFHLGQVLVSQGDVYLIDFEGEPLRSLPERSAKHSPLRDVAGMLRSLAYAGATARRALPDDLAPDTRAAREAWTDWWEQQADAAFLTGYHQAIGGCPGFPSDPVIAVTLLRLFLLEKALYEVGYELAHRPDWVGIPLAGVLALIKAAALEAPAPTTATGTTRAHPMPFGAEVQADGSVRFALWAPAHGALHLRIEEDGATAPMTARGDGWHELTTAQAQAGTRYRYILPGGQAVPDPASRFQPDDVHGPSEVIDPTVYRWNDADWRGRPWEETVLYELHVGTFTPEGSFRSVIDRLDHLVELGVTAVELMPVADFPGHRNWGYDGVLPYAPDSAYGRPEDLKALVDAAHGKGLMVFLDVVYNHFGPEGNYLSLYAPAFFTDRHKTPWGQAINYDGADSRPVRDFVIHNAMYWIEEFHLDGLRFDAVHAIIDDSPKHLLEELAERVNAAAGGRRQVHLVLENDANQARFLARDEQGRPHWYAAQWNDDAHHALHVAASGETGGYYVDYADAVDKLARTLAEGFAYQGEPSAYRDGEERGEPSAHLPPTAFVNFLQNHDQIGNRAFGDRITALARPEVLRAVGAVYLLSPSIPMLFMGEEWASAQPFPFFCDFGPDLAEAVRQGRRAEFAKFPEFQNPEARARIPDPTDAATFGSTRLDWDAVSAPQHATALAWHRRVLTVRRKEVVPRLPGITGDAATCEVFEGTGLRVSWRMGDGATLHLEANLSDQVIGGATERPGRMIWSEGNPPPDRDKLGPWTVMWTIE